MLQRSLGAVCKTLKLSQGLLLGVGDVPEDVELGVDKGRGRSRSGRQGTVAVGVDAHIVIGEQGERLVSTGSSDTLASLALVVAVAVGTVLGKTTEAVFAELLEVPIAIAVDAVEVGVPSWHIALGMAFLSTVGIYLHGIVINGGGDGCGAYRA